MVKAMTAALRMSSSRQRPEKTETVRVCGKNCAPMLDRDPWKQYWLLFFSAARGRSETAFVQPEGLA